MIYIKVGHKYTFFSLLKSLDLKALVKKQLEDEEIKKLTEKIKNGKKLPPTPNPTAPARDKYSTSHSKRRHKLKWEVKTPWLCYAVSKKGGEFSPIKLTKPIKEE